jgi:hypothetical protein
MDHCSKNIIRMEKKRFEPKSHNCFREAKKTSFCFIVAKKRFDAKKTAPTRISSKTLLETSEQIFCIIEHRSNFFLAK